MTIKGRGGGEGGGGGSITYEQYLEGQGVRARTCMCACMRVSLTRATPSLLRAGSCPGEGESVREVLTGTLPILSL